MKVDIQQLLSFGCVAENLSFSRAAALLNVDQPRVSRHVRALEERIGCPLLVRTTRSVTLTAEGAHLLRAVQPLQRAAAEAGEAIDLLVKGLDHQIRVGIAGSLGAGKRSELFEKFSKRFPRTQLVIQYATSADLLSMLHGEALDMAFVHQPFDRTGLHAVRFQRHPLMLLLPAQDPLADREQVPLELLVGRQVGLIPQKHLSEVMRTHIRTKLGEAGATILPLYDVATDAIYQSGADRGICYLLFSPSDALPLRLDGMVARWVDRDRLWRDSCLVRRSSLRNKWVEWFFDSLGSNEDKPEGEAPPSYALTHQ